MTILSLVNRASVGARTINLAQPKTCGIRVQKLVSADVTEICPGPSSYGPTRPIPIRICKREDLQRACQPKFCDCPQKPPPRTMKEILCGWTVFSAKGALAAGLVYWTVAQGIWGEAKDTEEFYERIRQSVASDSAFDDVSLPRLSYIKFKIIETYNRAIMAIMGVLVGVPMRINKKIQDALHPCEPVEDEDPDKKKKWK